MTAEPRLTRAAPGGEYLDLVRFRNDGDDFHVLWTARRALRLLDPRSGLTAVSIEGVPRREADEFAPDGLLVVDTAEYYGGAGFSSAGLIRYCQLKYSTTASQVPWPASDLAPTLRGFAEILRARCGQLDARDLAAKVRFCFVTNRPLSEAVVQALVPPHRGFDRLVVAGA